MMKFFPIMLILSLLIVLTGCREDLVRGPVHGIITAYDQYNHPETERSGIEIRFFKDSLPVSSTFTDQGGRYSINDLQYGRYDVEYYREGYIMTYENRSFNHVGGGVPYYMNFGLYEVPRFTVHLDSVRLLRDFLVQVFLKIDDDTVFRSRPSAYFIAFASDSQDVSRYDYDGVGKGYFTDFLNFPYNTHVAVCGLIGELGNIHHLASDSVYLVVYPLAGGQGYNFDQYLDAALGQPSNILKCKWPGR